MTSQAPTAWFATRRDNMYILMEDGLRNKVYALDTDDQEFSIITSSGKAVLGQLLKVDVSPEALLEDLDIREGDRILLIPHGSGG